MGSSQKIKKICFLFTDPAQSCHQQSQGPLLYDIPLFTTTCLCTINKKIVLYIYIFACNNLMQVNRE